jgi:hypothetical protein
MEVRKMELCHRVREGPWYRQLRLLILSMVVLKSMLWYVNPTLIYRNQAYEIARSSHCDSQPSNQYRFIIHRGPETCYRYHPPSCQSLQPTGRSLRREGLRRELMPHACRPHGWQDHLGRSLQFFVSPSL